MQTRGSWRWLEGQIETAETALRPVPHRIPDHARLLWLLNPPQDLEQQADEAIDRFSRVPLWQDALTDECRDLLLDRLMKARQICHVRRDQPDPPETFPELFRWLMIDCWYQDLAVWAEEVYSAKPADGA